MKTKVQLILLIIALSILASFGGCMEQIETDVSFSKIIGNEGGSTGRKILKLSDGNLMILGKTGTRSFDVTQTTYGIDVDKVQESVSSISILTPKGNLLKSKLFPINDLEVDPFLQYDDIENHFSFIDAREMPDGSFYIIGEVSNFLFMIPSLNVIQSEGTKVQILYKLSKDLKMEFARCMNGGPGWKRDFLQINPFIEVLPNGNFMVAVGYNLPLGNQRTNPTGYSLLELNTQGDTVNFKRFTNAPKKQAKAMTLDGTDLVLFSRINDNVSIHTVPINSLSSGDSVEYINYLERYPRFDGNSSFLFKKDEGYLTGYVNEFTSNVVIHTLSENKNIFSTFSIPVQKEYIRAASITANQDLLLYTEKLTEESDLTDGFLYRISEKEIKFKIPIKGIPGDVTEMEDGSILVLSNPIFNGMLTKTTLTRLSPDGKYF